MRTASAALLLLVLLPFASHAARANPGDLNRCVGADGRSVYTDLPCGQVGASIRPQAPDLTGSNKAAPTVRVHVRDCARSLPALRDGMQAALAAGDVNRLAAFYQWTGMGAATADGVLDRLQSLAGRPFIAVTVLRMHPAPPVDGEPADGPGMGTSEQAGGIAIDQTRSSSDPTPVRTVFGLTAYMGCWWVRF